MNSKTQSPVVFDENSKQIENLSFFVHIPHSADAELNNIEVKRGSWRLMPNIKFKSEPFDVRTEKLTNTSIRWHLKFH